MRIDSEKRRRPRLVYFQYDYDASLPKFLLQHKLEQVKCLSLFFDVSVVSEDCDLDRVCDSLAPDLILVESGVPNPACRQPDVSNKHTHRNIPRIGFLHADAFCHGRSGFISDMDHWGIETFFSLSTAARDFNPTISERIFLWPNFFDPQVFHDGRSPKELPVLLIGNAGPLYPWRRRVSRLLRPFYQAKLFTHPGYGTTAKTAYHHGHDYARLLASASFVPACGTVAREVVRKHFEIPACRSCLITERSNALCDAGFVDMENCIFADETDVLPKVEWLLSNPERLEEITSAGHNLVHSRHTIQHRSEIYDWFTLQSTLKAGETLIQRGPFDGVSVTRATNKPSMVVEFRAQLEFIRKGDEALRREQFVEAESYYRRCANFVAYMPEPLLRMAVCKLFLGNASGALTLLEELVGFTISSYRARDPDPVEWAYYLVALLCLGRVGTAIDQAKAFAWMDHEDFNFLRLYAASLDKVSPEPQPPRRIRRTSLHALPEIGSWPERLQKLLTANRQTRLAELTMSVQFSGVSPSTSVGSTETEIAASEREARIYRRFKAIAASKSFRQRCRDSLRDVLHMVETNLTGPVLPFRFSVIKNHEFLAHLREVVADETTSCVVLLGPHIDGISAQCIAEARRENPRDIAVLHDVGHGVRDLPHFAPERVDVTYVSLDHAQDLDRLPWALLRRARFTYIQGASTAAGKALVARLTDANAVVAVNRTDLLGGCVVLVRSTSASLQLTTPSTVSGAYSVKPAG